MAKAKFSDEFKRDAVAQIADRGGAIHQNGFSLTVET